MLAAAQNANLSLRIGVEMALLAVVAIGTSRPALAVGNAVLLAACNQ